jgi:uncharacterized phiE125 gp8 family phage protein
MIPTARQLVEAYTKRALILQTWEFSYDYLPAKVCFPKGILSSVTSVNVIAADGTETLQSASTYTVVAGDNGFMFLNSGSTWTNTDRQYDVFRVRFVVGWDDAASVPVALKKAMLIQLAQSDADREGEFDLSPAAKEAAATWKIWKQL